MSSAQRLRYYQVPAALCLVIGSLLFASDARAYSTIGERFVYNVNYMYYADSVWPWRYALDSARSSWNNAGSRFRMWYQSGAVNYAYGAYMGSTAELARTWWLSQPNPNQPWLYNDGRMRFNLSREWSASAEATKYDVESAAAHEFGHWGGLLELTGSGDTEKTMYWSMQKGETKKRSLHSDDIAGIRYVYGTP